MAAAGQSLLVPPLELPSPRFEVAARSQTCTETGGDWFTVLHDERSDVTTAIVADVAGHGAAAAQEASDTAKRTFEQGASAEGLPTIEVKRADLERGIPALELFRLAKLTASNGETRRLVAQSGVSINDQVVSDAAKSVGLADLGANGVIKLSRGKKQHALVRAV